MKFASIESKGGETFRGVEVTGVTEQAVRFRHAGGEETLAAADCPGLWVELFGLVAGGAPVSAPQAAKTDDALQSWMKQPQKGGQCFSETERKKRLRGIFDSAWHRSRSQMAAFKSEGFTWFQRESATQETLQRAEIDKVYESTVAELR